VSFVVDIHYSGDLFRLPTNRPHSDEDLLEEQPMARGLSSFLAEVHPHQMRSWVDNECCHIQLVFELKTGANAPRGTGFEGTFCCLTSLAVDSTVVLIKPSLTPRHTPALHAGCTRSI